MPKCRVIVHPGKFQGNEANGMDAYMRIVYSEEYTNKRICFQIFDKAGHDLWVGTCVCGVALKGSTLNVKKRMQAHIKVFGHEPGVVYTIPGSADLLEAKRKRNRSKE